MQNDTSTFPCSWRGSLFSKVCLPVSQNRFVFLRGGCSRPAPAKILAGAGRLLLVMLMGGSSLWAQSIRIEMPQRRVAQNQYFRLNIVVENETLKSHTSFPDIRGFGKAGTSSSSQTTFSNGRMSSSHTLSQNYVPQQTGTFKIPSFAMEVNGQTVEFSGGIVEVTPPARTQNKSFYPQNLFGFSNAPQEFVDVEDEAFLALSTDKSEIYVGEGVNLTLAFFVAESNRAPLQFHNLAEQVGGATKKFKPEKCWEEDFQVINVEREDIRLGGRPFARYVLYQASFFPLTEKDIHLPSVGIEFIKYKVARRPSFFGRNRKEDYKTYYTRPRTIRVKSLPPHPLRDQVSVGEYRLKERLDRAELSTGESFQYSFLISGRGNISALSKPQPTSLLPVEWYPPSVRQRVERAYGQVYGEKSFSFYGFPKEAGRYPLGEALFWVYFNPRAHAYDTLRATVHLDVVGKSRYDVDIRSSGKEAFYEQANWQSNVLESGPLSSREALFVYATAILVVFGVGFFLYRHSP